MSDGTQSARMILVGGGARSGKSRFALRRARALGARRVFVATGQALDHEMAARIAEHVRTRGDDFRTVEAPLDLVEALASLPDADVVVIDCLTLWLSNRLLRDEPAELILRQVQALARVLAQSTFHSVVVTNEVGMGIVPETPLGRAFRDLAGRAHQELAARADEIHVAILGTVLRLRPDPVTAEAAP